VVVELSAHPPPDRLNPLRPDWPVADEAEAVLISMGLAVEREDVVLPPVRHEVTLERVAFMRRRLHVGLERDAEVQEFLRQAEPQEQTVVALWWPGAAE
jgi:hypothetical protein